MKLGLEIVGISNNGGIWYCEGVSTDNASTEYVVHTENIVGVSSKADSEVYRSSGFIT